MKRCDPLVFLVNGSTANFYADNTFARDGFTPLDGNNAFTAIAQDAYGGSDSNSIVVNLPLSATFQYDLNGNMTNDSVHALDYDDENQLVTNTVAGSWKSEFVYDGRMRRRIRREYSWQGGTWVKTNEVRYVYDGNLVLQERDSNNSGTMTYTRGLDLSATIQGAGGIAGLLALSQPTTVNSQPAYYHCDGNGNVTALLNQRQEIVARHLYDPFGNTLSAAGPMAEANLYRFSSKEVHPNSGLVYCLYRCYDPGLQRWQNRDHIGELGGINLYRYVGNNPITAIDPLGLAWFDDLANWAQGEHAQFSEAMLATSGDGNNWIIAGALNTVSELAAGALSYPQALSQLGTGTGTFAGNPTLDNFAGVALDIAMAADVLAAGTAPLPGANKSLLKRCPKTAPAAEIATKLLNQFNSADSLIQNAGALTRLKGGKLMGTVTGDGEAIFKAVSQGGQTLPSGYVKMADGTIIGKHIASSTGEFTIGINKAGQIFKIRVNP